METGSTQMEAGLNHVHDLGDIVTDQRTQTQEFRFFLRSWYNTADIDAGTQNPNLRLQQLKMNVIPRPKSSQSERQ